MNKIKKSKSATSEKNQRFPNDVLFDIFLRLPIKSLLRLQLVEKQWQQVIFDDLFVKTHLERASDCQQSSSNIFRRYGILRMSSGSITLQSINHEASDHSVVKLNYDFENKQCPYAKKSCETSSNPLVKWRYHHKNLRCPYVEIFGSCNGLLLIGVDTRTYLLWNPATGKYNKFMGGPFHRSVDRPLQHLCPWSECYYDSCRKCFRFPQISDSPVTLYGLGYDSSSDDYKVVVAKSVLDHRGNYMQTRVRMFSLKKNDWKKIEEFPYKIKSNAQAAITNGALYWVVNRAVDSNSSTIVYFDLADEKIKELPKPDFLEKEDAFVLGAFDGQLCVSVNNAITMDIWTLKDCCMNASWTRMLVIPVDINRRVDKPIPLSLIKSGQILVKSSKEYRNTLGIYHPEDTFKNIAFSNDNLGFKSISYVESLIFPPGGKQLTREKNIGETDG